MKSKLLIIIQSMMIITLVWIIFLIGSDKIFLDNDIDEEENDEEIIIDYTELIDGLTYVRLPSAVEKNSGITTQPLTISSEVSDVFSYGEVVNLTDLFTKKNNLANLFRKKIKLENRLEGELDFLKKIESLNRDNKNIADNVILEKEGDIDILQNDLVIIKNDINNIIINTEHKWGEFFGKHIAQAKNKVAKNLFDNKYRLINITIPSSKLASEMPNTIKIFLPHDNKKIYKGNFVSDAPSSNISLQGKSFFYVVENNDIKLGSKVKADITKINSQTKEKKLFIPSKSVVWSNGKPWVFVKKVGDEGIFLRKPLIEPLETENGLIVLEENLKTNDLVVVDGAQLLLSEEFKYQIKNENED
tara:strand:- start:26036 stop:27115 length:1080 start_codon:yes stop_codon:yes gene_type:complete